MKAVFNLMGRRFSAVPGGQLAPRLAAALGALFGILVTGLISRLWLGTEFGALYLIAPMGASAVLLFAVPASPLVQPWPVVGGNFVSAIVGITCAKFISDPVMAGAAAVGTAIAVMAVLRCIHPPGGAVALTCVLAWPSIAEVGYGFALGPVAVNTVLLFSSAYLFHKVSGRSYPHRVPADGGGPVAVPSSALSRVGFTRQDVANALRRYGDELDVLPQDLEALFRKVEGEAIRRHEDGLTCEDIMTRNPVSAQAHMTVETAARLLVQSGQRALPVIDEAGHVLGLVGDRELTQALLPPASGRTGLLSFIKPASRRFLADVMTRNVRQFLPDTSVLYVAQVLAQENCNAAPICDVNSKLLGLVTRQDVLAAVSRDAVEDMLEAAG